MFTELRSALRQLARSPGFAAVAVLTLALGIGLSTSSFSLANTFLLRNVPYPDADRLVRIFATSRQSQRNGHATGNAVALREAATSFAGISLYNFDSSYSFGEPGQPVEQVSVMSVSADFFDTLGVQPSQGRGFTSHEDQGDQSLVVVLTHRAWIRRFAGATGVIGRSVRLNSQQYTVIGILPEQFEAPLVWGPVEFIVPRPMTPDLRNSFKDSWMQLVARLKPGVSIDEAQTELATIASRLEQAHPKENAGRGIHVVDLAQSNMDSVSRGLLWLMTGISLAMLLIACANLASLQVARAFGRSREFAVRAALGGSRRHLMTPLLIESVTLALLGGIGGIFVGTWSNDIIGSMLIINNEPGYTIPMDTRVLVFTLCASVLSGVAFGLAPAWLAARSPAAEALKEGSRSSTGSRSQQRLKSVLIVCELAVALTLVGVAASFGIGSRSFLTREVGWNINGLFAGYLALPYTPYGDNARSEQFYRNLEAKLAAIPGVEHAAICRSLPMYSLGSLTPMVVEGQPAVDDTQRPLVDVGSVTSDFFATLQIPLKQGTGFSPSLTAKDPPVALINESFARRFWPDENPIGHRVRLGDNPAWIEIIGVVNDISMRSRLTAAETPLQLYRPTFQNLNRYVTLVLRSPMAPDALTRSVREAVASLDADLPVAAPGSLLTSYERNLANLNLVIVNLGISAGMGLLIAAVGLFGVISQLTMQRTRDLGVRMALGAQAADIMRLVIGDGVKLLVVGIAVGVPFYFLLNFLLTRVMPAMQLPGLWLLAANLAVLAATMLLACYLPALRATRINPVEALRTE